MVDNVCIEGVPRTCTFKRNKVAQSQISDGMVKTSI